MDSSLGVSTADPPHATLFIPTPSTWMRFEFGRVPLAVIGGPFFIKKRLLPAPAAGRLEPATVVVPPLLAVCEILVSLLVSVTDASGTSATLASVTVP